jgi:hypothetical protein
MPNSAPKWAKELRKSLLAEIAAIETGQRVYEFVGKAKTDVTAAALKRLQLRLQQVEALISSYE